MHALSEMPIAGSRPPSFLLAVACAFGVCAIVGILIACLSPSSTSLWAAIVPAGVAGTLSYRSPR